MTGVRVRSFGPSVPGIGGVLVLATWLLVAISSSAQTFNVLVTFNGTNGDDPEAALVQGTDGNYYGTTFFGGIHVYGTVFKVSPAGELTTLYNFCSTSGCLDGAMPVGGLLLATNGVMYGTTTAGGANKCTVGTQTQGCGTIFQISPGGAFTTLYSFAGSDGSFPVGPLVQGTDGNLYGTTVEGGAADEGTVFMITPSGTETVLYSFKDRGKNGGYPFANLINVDGELYGTTAVGGATDNGTVFKITTAGVETVLYWFNGGKDGAVPMAGLIYVGGELYGTTVEGGASNNGTVFKVKP